jgi:hypothetical protein
MAGKDESARLQGMLSEIAGTVGEMGAGRDWGANAIRQIARPDNQAMFRGEEFKLDNSANLIKMGQWAERNGYEDKAKQYMALGASQQKVEQKKAYTTSVATGTEKLRGIRGNIAGINQEIARQEAAGVVNPDLLDARDALTNQLNTTVSNLNAMGSASNYGNGAEGAEAMRSIDAYVYEQEKQDLEIGAARNNALEDYQAQLDRGFQASVDPNMYMDPAQQAAYEADFKRARATLEQRMGEGREEFKAALILFNERRAKAAKTQNEKYWTKVEAQAVKLGELGVEKMLADLNREGAPASSFGGKFKRFVNNLFTDQADVVDWASNPDNQLLIQKAIERVASTAPYSVPGWDSKTPSERLDIITKDVIANLEQNPAFKEELAEDRIGRTQDRESVDNAAKIKDLDEGTMPGTKVGDQYQVYLQSLDQQYIDAGYPGGVKEVRETNPEEWERIQEKWRELLGRTEGVNMTSPAMMIGNYPRK